MNYFRALKLFYAVFLLAGFPAVLLAENPKNIHPAGYVTDLAGVLSADTKTRLETLCTELEQKTGAQMAIVTVHSLNNESVEDYAVDLYKQFGVGSKKDNRGVLLLLSPDEHKYRIEVGYGLEPVINDARAGDAGRAMVPFLRQRYYSKAVEAAAWMLAKYIADDKGVSLSGQPPRAPPRRANPDENSWPLGPLLWLAFIGIFFLLSRVGRHSGGRRRGFGGWWIGPMMGGGWGGGGFGGGGGGFSGGGGFGGFGGGSSGGGGASGSW